MGGASSSPFHGASGLFRLPPFDSRAYLATLPEAPPVHGPATSLSVPFHLTFVGLTDTGRVRKRNEDSLALSPELGVAVVADGMGGHPGGDVASSVAATHAVDRIRALVQRHASESITPPLADAMAGVVVDAHRAIQARGLREPHLAGMGTTLTVLALDSAGNRWSIGHVGDSRAYLLRHGSFRQLTRDDTWVQQRVDAAELTPDQARRHPFGHILTQCLGLEKRPEPQVLEGPLQEGDIFLLCTDGLVGMLEDELVSDALRAHVPGGLHPPDLEGAANALVTMANDRGGYDNITVALIAVG